jgi:2-polyprenyl-3-methyl-5-hydroxy-6-metoxy-1,4-benzoquinol methylase
VTAPATGGPAPHVISDSRQGVPACPICRAPDASFFAWGHDRLFGLAPGKFPTFRCADCRCIFQSPMPEESRLGDFYPPDYWWSGERQLKGIARQVQKWERKYRDFVIRDHVRFLLRCARNHPAGRSSLLDIGCGSGSFLTVSARNGFACFGMDRSLHAVRAAGLGSGIEVRQGDIGSRIWDGRCFDFVTLFHVLEHLPDPRSALQYAGSLLAPGGRLIVQVPNVSSLQASLFGRRWYGLDVPRHLINFSPEALAIVLLETGFETVASARFSLRDNPASIASSLFPSLDPIGRRGRAGRNRAPGSAFLELLYLGVFLGCIPLALLESLLGRGGTLWVGAKRKRD